MKRPFVTVKIPKVLYDTICVDLKRPHPHAGERVGFVSCVTTMIDQNEAIINFTDYLPLKDNHYKTDNSVGAHINTDGIREGLNFGIRKKEGVFHVHEHFGSGIPRFSPTDLKGLKRMLESFQNASKETHGLLLLNEDSLNCLIWIQGHVPFYSDRILVVGNPIRYSFPVPPRIQTDMGDRHSRQSFLGVNSEFILKTCRIGVVGMGGGGSHLVQQLAHIGIRPYVVYDDDNVEDTNLNRLVGGKSSDILKKKLLVAKRIINGLLSKGKTHLIEDKWQNQPKELWACDIVLSGIDGLQERNELELECRRFQIPLIDIGMDVYKKEDFYIRGQIILSMPGQPCMWCSGFLNNENITKEKARYGDVGGNPQVVWTNGVLASGAIGVMIDLLTGWGTNKKQFIFRSYDGNNQILQVHPHEVLPNWINCIHHPNHKAGVPKLG